MNDQGLDTMVAGVRCRDVLADLSEYLDGALDAPRVAQLQGHVAECSHCARFGGHIARTLTALRRAMPAETRDQGPAILARIAALPR